MMSLLVIIQRVISLCKNVEQRWIYEEALGSCNLLAPTLLWKAGCSVYNLCKGGESGGTSSLQQPHLAVYRTRNGLELFFHSLTTAALTHGCASLSSSACKLCLSYFLMREVILCVRHTHTGANAHACAVWFKFFCLSQRDGEEVTWRELEVRAGRESEV